MSHAMEGKVELSNCIMQPRWGAMQLRPRRAPREYPLLTEETEVATSRPNHPDPGQGPQEIRFIG